MIRYTILLFVFVIVLPFVEGPVYAQGNAMNIDEFTEYLAVSGIEKSAVKEALAALVNDTENLNKALDYILSQNERWAILKNLNLQFKMLKGSDADSVSDLGLSYAWSTDIKQTLLSSTSAGMTGINLQASADGNVTFNEKNNPFNFLESSLSFHFYRSQGGAITATRETAIKLDSLTELLAMITNEEEYAQSPLLKELLDIHFDHMTTQYYLDLSVHGGMESNQAFTQKNYVLGTQLGFDLKAWNPNSTLAGWNVFDWPFALVRWMTGTDTKPTPLGTVFPTVLCGLDYIDPDHDSYRAAVGDSSGYLRINAETAFKTPIARTSGATVFLQADVRYFRELAPSDKVESADLEDYVYFTAALVSSKGFYAGYTNGKLPFDNQSDEVYEVGFVFDF